MDPQSPRPRSRAFSFRSNSSDKDKTKGDLKESPIDKARRDSIWKLKSKSNPNSAINEIQPAALAASELSTLESLRATQHRDINGNIITEPDLSNPTRPRWERPLDTIRSFERAIDGEYDKRSSTARTGMVYGVHKNLARVLTEVATETPDAVNGLASRRTSYHGGYDSGPSPSRYSSVRGGYYNNRRPDSYIDGNYVGPAPTPGRNRFGARMASDPTMVRYSGGQQVYPQHTYHQSHDTVNTGVTNGSDSTGPWANSTDPSSENSSLDRVSAAAKPAHMSHNGENYGANGGHFHGPIMEEYGPPGSHGGAYPQQMHKAPNGYGGAPPPPPVRAPIKLGGDPSSSAIPPQGGSLPSTARSSAKDEKKKGGWLKRKFSKHD
ncbi:hypothetical protein LTR28_009079 [Elasticomyces elasticus]|nr:hypothetical protein LTR28_009079 [Elasticomyces elasticus]